MTEEQIQDLAVAIKEEGPKAPLKVYPLNDDGVDVIRVADSQGQVVAYGPISDPREGQKLIECLLALGIPASLEND